VRRVLLYALPLLALPCAYVVYLLYGSLPDGADGRDMDLPGLTAPVRVAFDSYGIPSIEARNREDAFEALGFATARDRLFQMDLLRRKMAGRLAEVLGAGLLKPDRWHRTMGFDRLAPEILARLPEPQRRVVRAYTRGVNRAIQDFKVLPFEFLLLGYRPEPWRAEDSILAVLNMYTALSWRGDIERSTAVVRAALPAKVADFLLPDTDAYTQALLGEPAPAEPLPTAELAALAERNREAFQKAPRLVNDAMPKRGSNAWVVAPAKTADGRAILANDMHLSLGVPTLWYRAELHYGEVRLAGLTLPGLPLIVSGSNQGIAWGFTASGTDVSDFVPLEVDPANSKRYRAGAGFQDFGERVETLRVRDGASETLVVRTTPFGPVAPEPLLGKPVAVRWTALDPAATNLDYMDLDRVTTVEAALPALNHAGGPPLHAFVADAGGNIGWTLTGRIPRRPRGDHSAAWQDYIPAAELPRRFNPPEGFIVSANQRMVDARYPYAVDTYDWRGYRAYRIAGRLREMRDITERDMFSLQLDAQTDFYRYYWNLALDTLGEERPGEAQAIGEARRYLRAWDGRADLGTPGLALVIEFRKALLETVLSPLFVGCHALDSEFEYRWNYPDVPLRRLIDARLPALLPTAPVYPDWDALLRDSLLRAAAGLKQRYGLDRLEDLTWARANPAHIAHPLSAALSWLAPWLDMPTDSPAGCDECVNSFEWDGGPSERLVVAPGHEPQGFLHLPGGQSGHPLSPNYRDQYRAWVTGRALPLLVGAPATELRFAPTTDPSSLE